jgi:cytochrome c oxidase cbb3-type subunit III
VQLANVQFLAQASDAFIRHAIVRGRPGTKMEPYAGKLNDAQIDDVVAFVRRLGTQAPTVQQLPAPTGKEPLVLNPAGRDPTFTLRKDRFVGVDQVKKALTEKRRMIIIDARPPSEWMRVHIKGAVSIPYHDLKRLEEIPPGVWAIAYCACPHHLSGDVVDALIKRGHKRALVLDEGINEWHRRGYPVVAAEGMSLPAQEPTIPR